MWFLVALGSFVACFYSSADYYLVHGFISGRL